MVAVIDSLRQQIASCEATLRDLRQQLAEAEHVHRQQENALRKTKSQSADPLDHDMNFGIPDDFRSEVFAILEHGADQQEQDDMNRQRKWPLEKNEYARYGRQLIMPEIGLQGELRITDFFGGLGPSNSIIHRPASPQTSPCPCCRSWGLRMSCCSISSRSRSWHRRLGRR